jgi:hypothetical protein
MALRRSKIVSPDTKVAGDIATNAVESEVAEQQVVEVSANEDQKQVVMQYDPEASVMETEQEPIFYNDAVSKQIEGDAVTLYVSNNDGKIIVATGDAPINANCTLRIDLRTTAGFSVETLHSFNTQDWSNLSNPNDRIKFVRSFLAKYVPKAELLTITEVH